jgi:hypothetical protein
MSASFKTISHKLKGSTMRLTTIALVFTLTITSVTVQANDSTQHSGQASKHSVLAAGYGAASTAKVASAVVAVPLVVAGSMALTAGVASVHTGASIADATSKHTHHGPLIITETTITADPAPNKVIIIQKEKTVFRSQ